MNREAIQELYALDDFVWSQVKEIVSESGALTKPAPGSGWPTLRDCLTHIIFGLDNWYALTGSQPRGDSETVQTLAEIDDARSSLRGRIDALMAGLSDQDLHEIRTFNIRGEKMPYSYAELLAHLALHERGHHGDMTTLFWQLGIEADTSFEYRFMLAREPLP